MKKDFKNETALYLAFERKMREGVNKLDKKKELRELLGQIRREGWRKIKNNRKEAGADCQLTSDQRKILLKTVFLLLGGITPF